MLKGYVINNTGRGSHIFKRPVSSGMKVSLDSLYDMYRHMYDGPFDTGFLDWLKENKLRPGFELILEEILEEDVQVKEEEVDIALVAPEKKLPIPSRITAAQISELKIKDNPKKIIQRIQSKHKLRRALTLCKDRKGKETLVKYIRERMSQLP